MSPLRAEGRRLTRENGGVARLHRQRGDVCDDLGTGLEDDEEDADGARDALQVQAIVQPGVHGDLAD